MYTLFFFFVWIKTEIIVDSVVIVVIDLMKFQRYFTAIHKKVNL